ncbi:HAD family hydrolase [Uliginosibacterium sp. sgz301328]|uniref:HAD family hydrolase n=1 Tax=Uliginosibacterium sp. sgz301328 TaxID=3243764 RepID=UPI00359F0DB5
MIRAVLFDLDGTLADTAPDLGGALNRVLTAHGRDAIPLHALRPFTSQGVRGLLRAGFGIGQDSPDYTSLADEVLQQYQAHICDETRLFQGMDQLLDELEARGLRWGIVTNKHARFTTPLIDALGLGKRAACIVSGDTTARAKPAPDSLLFAARAIEISADACIYVGDDKRDIVAAQSAAMLPVAAQWGYLGVDDPIETWGASHILQHPLQVLDCLGAAG